MDPRKIPALLLVSIFFSVPAPQAAWASDQEIKSLKKEVQELKQSVVELKTLVQQQNQRIEALTGDKTSAVAPPPQRVAAEQVTPSPTPTADLAAATPGPTPSPSAYRQLGFWKVPVSQTGASRFIPNISVNGVFAVAYFTDDPGEIGHNPSRTGFNLQEIEVAFQSVIDPYIRADVFLSFHEEGVELEEGYITTLSLPKGLQVKGGKYLLPFGRQNPKHLEKWAFVDNNLVNQRLLGPEGFNELGFEVSYLFSTPFFLLLQSNMTQGTTEENFDGERKGDFAYTGRLSGSTDLTDNLTLLAGSSAAFGFNNTGSGNSTMLLGGDLLLSWRPSPYTGIDWQTEYIYRSREVPGASENSGGLYSYLIGNWSKRWGTGLRVDYMGIPNEGDRTFRLSPMVVFRTTEFFQVKAQYELIDDELLGIQQAAFLQWIFTMGPHGAHPF
jgi:hypothetical protein